MALNSCVSKKLYYPIGVSRDPNLVHTITTPPPSHQSECKHVLENKNDYEAIDLVAFHNTIHSSGWTTFSCFDLFLIYCFNLLGIQSLHIVCNQRSRGNPACRSRERWMGRTARVHLDYGRVCCRARKRVEIPLPSVFQWRR